MAGIDIGTVAAAVARAKAAMPGLEQELNEADSRLGDGDTGSMLARVIDRMADTDLGPAADVGAAFGLLARATLSATGSSLGTLVATGLMDLAKRCKGRSDLDWSDLSVLIAGARDAMIARGGAALGDKTVLDGLDALARATAGVTTGEAAAAAAVEAADGALDQFRGLPCRIGRARLFPEASTGADDPGMLALARLVSAAAGR
ncbi:DAK2 domain-containing protein [Azospirillum sp. HJ39]|uniref:DAK2 domain-containing protein n=1 Tax=Azospirillum sp. HJ39 TaxID=3159496 RepID=UPI0035585A5E